RVIVEGVNVVKKHEKPSNANPDGGIINKELPISVSNVKLVDDKKKKTAKKSAKKNVKGAKK
ncbi:MAG: 50S ribosomal protein L24, partial [Erysipelotrichaceae bacterium]|nr:50S ribosomal protein L24 [Erysipelotrichaceae bacterium]